MRTRRQVFDESESENTVIAEQAARARARPPISEATDRFARRLLLRQHGSETQRAFLVLEQAVMANVPLPAECESEADAQSFGSVHSAVDQLAQRLLFEGDQQ